MSTFIFGDGYTSPTDGILTLAAFLMVGLLLGLGNGRRIPLLFVVQFICATFSMRLSESYLVYHQPMREGLWPLFWGLAAVLGIRISKPRSRET